MDDFSVEYIQDLAITQGKTHSEVSSLLKEEEFPDKRGLSSRSVRRFCDKNGIHLQNRLSNDELEQCTKDIVARVGPTWGRKMVKGYMNSCGITAGEKRIGRALSVVSPAYQAQRNSNTARQINPFPCHADYFGHKLHLDQNEKLGMYGLTEVSACDGYSGKIVAFATMPMKNNLLIYENIYRPAILQYDVWDQIRVDHGADFYLSLYIQEKLSAFRTNTRRAAFIQTTSKQNHPAERKWVEFNSRVNYPIKRVLNSMVNDDLLNMDDDMNKFCVSWFTSRVAGTGIKQVIASWNNHTIPGKGVPDERMMDNNKTFVLPSIHMLLTSEEAVAAYESEGGHLSAPDVFGVDLLAGNLKLQKLRSEKFNNVYPSFDGFFHTLVNGTYYPFQQGLLFFIDLTTSLNPN